MHYTNIASVPMHHIGPVKIIGEEINDEIMVPLATYESPLWPSTNRGAKVSRLAGGIRTAVIQDCMTRSVIIEAPTVILANNIMVDLQARYLEISEVVATTSRFAKLKDLNFQIVGKLLYVRISISSGDASGHNMVTAAAESVLNWVLAQYEELKYISISGNYCVDKKASAVNGILGRGKYVVAEIVISRSICCDVLKTTPEKVVELNIKKNLIGTMLAGGIRSANAHFANVLLGFYLATGQDAANIIEGSQGFVHAEITESHELYFSVTLPNIIVGSIGNGKQLDFAKNNLEKLGCLDAKTAGANGRRLAAIIAATVLCGELSLLAAQTNNGELMRAHFAIERSESMRKEVTKE
jgi:hydroxymethylglutaryl-CoA reductase (NADPH)